MTVIRGLRERSELDKGSGDFCRSGRGSREISLHHFTTASEWAPKAVTLKDAILDADCATLPHPKKQPNLSRMDWFKKVLV